MCEVENDLLLAVRQTHSYSESGDHSACTLVTLQHYKLFIKASGYQSVWDFDDRGYMDI